MKKGPYLVGESPRLGLYVLGLPYLRRRKSSFIHGAEDDVRELGMHLADYLDRTARGRIKVKNSKSP